MIKKLLSITLLFYGCITVQSQIVKGQIISKTTSKPIYRAAVVTNLQTGTESNKNGEYELQINHIKSVTFSCLGFSPKTLSLKDLQKRNFRVVLVEDVNQLDEIQLNLTKINLDSLLIKTQRRMQESFVAEAIKGRIYAKEYSEIDFKNLDLALEKSTLLSRKSRKLAEKELMDYAKKLRESNPKVSSEYFGALKAQKKYSEKWKRDFNFTEIDTIEGITFLNNDKNITIETAQKDLQNIVLKHLDTNKTYKISSGLFKIEDSLSLKEIIRETDSLASNASFDKNYPKYYYNDAYQNATFFKSDNKNNFLSQKYYEHYLDKNEYLGNKLFYCVNFEPRKSKSKFSGKIYIDPKNYTIKKITYAFAEGKKGLNFNLKWVLGVKVSQNINKGTIYYETNNNDKVYASYFKETLGDYAYVHRPIKFKENSKEKQKVKFDIKIEVNVLSTKEVLLSDIKTVQKIENEPKEKTQLVKKVPYLSLNAYNKTIWKNRALIIDYLKTYE
ncbi:carboxypeptidase-like regulatory domain-containing protein [Polaribacter sp. R77954]|uniref:carboxypeptidase-like regulatory domain-containing protein n=1 Tax=Polaribacter sp. R77954 TaxID=3093870 RepID=UPI0037C51AB5